ncbi:OsmC family protein [bacterium endosymbiont of Bathymodiolus sp. 5 South]|jgi:putative redox protein|uniref:OsmC family protein n=1 Tax=bacterium endosymbiont of Bathymodiolus sp. 5 South TaxID=1181670 RepID=UPI0010B32AC4|nr:OsmC family protein [bacterium endosymbiont of Bathymodiolus sp. 5 South]VVH56451.1 OsmC/Ohr family protein [uncultured Gammaproteobacteria bacterium]SHN93486.1 OsmC/Ohr family protein [bacterium endosymbiont of Bathymodiolus sp. 5 South]SSC08100.1 OsmC/Ohr family protein [bacterium endosymbiont of Bathymodiolus sp. 5 South]VVH62789.1 OsmC/Ohr family protein [uncultured Gammaproteobacteria bacterium]VVM22637.1 OsmC/Ohr family protein [uncultured Gammaproteobacteria bacterium]
MNSTVKWIDNMMMLGTSASGHAVVMDGPEELGGKNLGIRPMEMLLLGMGGCTTIDVVSTLKKMRETVRDCRVEISTQRAEEHPKIFTKIHLHFIIKGTDLNDKKVAKAISLSADKYCSASIMLGKTARITHDFEIHE